MKLSIIIPVCNVELYIGPCLESIYRQGLDDHDFEVVVIDDGSTDHSMRVVKETGSQHHNIHIISLEHAGPSVCRNAGMEMATGDYVVFGDSDDLLMDHGLVFLLRKALETSADMVVADFMRVKDEEVASGYESLMTDDGIVDKTGYDYYVEDYDPGAGSFIWRILYRRRFLNENGIRFVPGMYYEDIPFLQACYLKAQRVIGVHLLYYVYRIRPRSCTYSFTMKNALDYHTAIALSWRLMDRDGLPERVCRKLEENVYLLFNYAVDCIIGVFRDPAERKDAVDDLVRKVPGLRFSAGTGPKVVSFLFRTMPYGYIRWRLFKNKGRNWVRARLG